MLKKFYKHLLTISKHRHMVMEYCFKSGLIKQGLLHDLSKYSYIEFSRGVKYFIGNKSPIGNERKDLGYSLAFLHHKGCNKHHLEYWFDPYALNRRISMPDIYILESICDRIAAAKVYLKESYTNNSPLEYFLNDHKVTDFILKEEYDKFYFLLKYLSIHGEKELFSLMKKYKKAKKITIDNEILCES